MTALTPVLLCITIFATTIQSVFKKKVNAKFNGCEFSISTLITLFALVSFLIVSDLSLFTSELLPYCLILSVCYATAAVTCVLAIGCGSLALTNLALAYSKAIPIFYSITFGTATLNTFQICGLICLGASMIFTYYKRDGGGVGITMKWLIYAVLLFLSNGMCGVVMQARQDKFGTSTDGAFMVVSLIFATSFLLIAAIIREKKGVLRVAKSGIHWCAMCGASNGVANFFGLKCLSIMNRAVYYPITSAGDLILTFVFSVVLFKEKLKKNQVVGFIFGIISMILINIK